MWQQGHVEWRMVLPLLLHQLCPLPLSHPLLALLRRKLCRCCCRIMGDHGGRMEVSK
jgi:hypothetical protein